jgi:hypothetical protein
MLVSASIQAEAAARVRPLTSRAGGQLVQPTLSGTPGGAIAALAGRRPEFAFAGLLLTGEAVAQRS